MLVWAESCQRLRTNAEALSRYFSGEATWNATGGGRANGPNITGQVIAYPQQPVPSGRWFFGGARMGRTNAFVSVQSFGPLLSPAQFAYNSTWPTNWSTALQTWVRYNGDGSLSIYRKDVAIATSPAGLFPNGSWHYVALEVYLHDSAGSVRVFLDGVEVPSLTLSGIATTNANTAGTWNAWWLGSLSGGQCHSFMDVYVADETDPSGAGYDVHDLVPEVAVDYRPASGNGYLSQWAGNDGNSVNNFELVDETTPDGDTTYVSTQSAAIDAYQKAACPNPAATIIGAAVYARAKKTNAGVSTMRVGMRSGSTNVVGNVQANATAYGDVYHHVAHDPADGAFSVASMDAAQLLIEKV